MVVNSLFTAAAKANFLSNINNLPFINHTTLGGVGASPKEKARVHRASSSHPSGSVSIINKDVFRVMNIEGEYEEILRDFVAEVYQEHDRIIASQDGLIDLLKKIPINKEGKLSIFPDVE